MSIGVSPLYYPKKQPPPLQVLRPDNCYFRVKLHHVQAYFEAGWLTRPAFLTLSSSVKSSFQPTHATQSLHQITTIQKNVPCQIGVRTNLTDWLPARATDSLRISLNYAIVRDTPFKQLVEQIERLDLVAQVSMVRPDWAVAVKVSQIVGQLLSYLLQEGQTTNLFELTMDLNLSELKSGFYVVLGSLQEADWPTKLQINEQERLVSTTHLLDPLCIAVIKILTLPRRGPEIARNEPWWELLQAEKEEALYTYALNDQERQQALTDWRATLAKVRTLARKERGYLLTEISEIIQQAHAEVNAKYFPTATEANLDLPQQLQQLLGVRSEEELYQSVRDYQDALDISRRLLSQYQ